MTSSQEGAEYGSPAPEPAAEPAQPQASAGESGDPARPWQVNPGEAGDPARSPQASTSEAGGLGGPSVPPPPPFASQVPPMPPISTQPYPGQPYPGQSYPGQPYSGQSYPGQPYPGQPYPAPVYYPGYPGYPQYVQRRGTNGLAIAALVCGIVFSPLGIVFGFVALNQIKQSGEEGRGLALAGIWVGAATLALMVLYFTFFFILFDQFMRDLPPVQ